MNLQPVSRSSVLAPALDRITNGTHTPMRQGTDWHLGWCVGVPQGGCGGSRAVLASTGFADLDGSPFKAYYCPACAAVMRS